jgi:hypothetical protein
MNFKILLLATFFSSLLWTITITLVCLVHLALSLAPRFIVLCHL